MFNKVSNLIIVLLVLVAVWLGSYTARTGEIDYNADVARDFLLYNELSHDPIMLIGPRSDYKGLFHGPLWLYVNFPAYLVGQGNPVAISWWWIFLTLGCAGLNYWIAKQLFDKQAALYFAALFTVMAMHYVDHYYNPVGAMLISPLLIFFTHKYIKTKELKYMIGQLLVGAGMLQFQIAAGIPVLLLSGALLLYFIIKNKKYSHLLGFLAVPLALSNFLLFELKFNFPQINGVMNHFNGSIEYVSLDFRAKVVDRIDRFSSAGSGFFFGKHAHYSRAVIVLMLLIITRALVQLKNISKKAAQAKSVILLILFYFFGFYLLSFIHNGYVLVHYYLPFAPLVLLLFAGLHTFMDKKVYAAIIVVLLLLNISNLNDQNIELSQKKDNVITSWTFMKNLTSNIPDTATDPEVGVFIYAPDAYAYGPKYAVLYEDRNSDISIVPNQKKRETYLLYEPAPENQPWLNGSYWKTDLVSIKSDPIETKTLPNGYRIEKYILSEEEQAVPVDPLALDWVSQR